jgi:ribosomal protein L37E
MRKRLQLKFDRYNEKDYRASAGSEEAAGLLSTSECHYEDLTDILQGSNLPTQSTVAGPNLLAEPASSMDKTGRLNEPANNSRSCSQCGELAANAIGKFCAECGGLVELRAIGSASVTQCLF